MIYFKTINLVYCISFTDLFAVGLIYPLISTHLLDLGASHTAIGFISSTYFAVQVVTGPIIGGWSDIKDRKSVLKIILLVCGVCYFLLGVSSSIFVIFLIRFTLGVTKHTQSICKAVISDLLPPEEHTDAFGKTAALGAIGFILGPFIGGHMSELNNGFMYVCTITSILFLLNMALASYLPENETKDKKQNNTTVIKSVKKEFSKILRDLRDVDWKVHWDTFLIRFLFGAAMTCFLSNQSLLFKEKYSLSQKHIGYIISYFSTVGVVASFFIKQINNLYKNDQNGNRKLVDFFSILTICYLGMYISSSIWSLLFILIPFSVSSTVLRIISMEQMMRKAEKLHSGSFSGASNSVMSISRLTTPFLTGLLSDVFSEQSVVLVALIPSCLAIIVSFYMMKTAEDASVKDK